MMPNHTIFNCLTPTETNSDAKTVQYYQL